MGECCGFMCSNYKDEQTGGCWEYLGQNYINLLKRKYGRDDLTEDNLGAFLDQKLKDYLSKDDTPDMLKEIFSDYFDKVASFEKDASKKQIIFADYPEKDASKKHIGENTHKEDSQAERRFPERKDGPSPTIRKRRVERSSNPRHLDRPEKQIAEERERWRYGFSSRARYGGSGGNGNYGGRDKFNRELRDEKSQAKLDGNFQRRFPERKDDPPPYIRKRRGERSSNPRHLDRPDKQFAQEWGQWRYGFSSRVRYGVSGGNGNHGGRDKFNGRQGYQRSNTRTEQWKHDLYQEVN